MARLSENSRKQVAFPKPAGSQTRRTLLWLVLLLTCTVLLPLSSAVGQIFTLCSTDDAYIIHGSPDYNTGTEPALIIRNDYGIGGTSGWGTDALIKFDLSQYANQTITSAKLKLRYYAWYDNDPAGRVLKLFRNISDWDEFTVIWNNQPGHASLPTSSCAVPAATETWMEWDVTTDVQAMLLGSISNYGWHLLDDNYWGQPDIPSIRFRSKEFDTTYCPKLEIVVVKQTLYPTDDAYIIHGSPDYNTGTEPALIIRNDYGIGGTSGWGTDVLIKFDLSQYANQTITSAKLKLRYYEWHDNDPAGRVLKLFSNTADWDELTVTWNNQPGHASLPTSSCAVPAATETWMEWDVTTDVQAMLLGSISNYGWHLLDDNYWGQPDIPSIRFRSKEYGTYSPRLDIDVVSYIPGDASGDGVVDIGDVVYLINYLFKSGPAPYPLIAGDANCDGVVDVGDVIYLINYLFKGGPVPSCK